MSPFDRTLRWYPRDWRQRYGGELTALLEDTYGQGPLPRRCHLSLVKAGLLERLRGPRPARNGDVFGERVRSGSLLVLCAWAVFIVAGAGYAKFVEHWDMATPPDGRRVPADAYAAVQWAAFLGTLIVLASAVLCLPTLVRLVRRGGWPDIRRPVLRAVLVSWATALGGVGVVIWAHHLPARGTSGGGWPYALGGAAIEGVMIVASLVLCAAAAVVVVGRIHLDGRVLRAQGVLALVMTSLMAVITAGTVTWWVSVARVAPRFLGSGPGGSAGSLVPPAMAVAGALMVGGLATAVLGAIRVAGAIPQLGSDRVANKHEPRQGPPGP